MARDGRRISSPATVSIEVTPVLTFALSSDITRLVGELAPGGDAVVREVPSGTVSLVDVGSLPSGVNVDAYHALPDGDRLLSLDVPAELPGGVIAEPADVVRFDGVGYTLVFDAAAQGIPAGANVDAVAMAGADLLLSFDVPLTLPGGVTAGPADLVRFDGTAFTLFFDAAAAGVPAGLDVDASDHLASTGRLLISFDGSACIGEVCFGPADVLELDPATGVWRLVYDGAVRQDGWGAANLDAVSATLSGIVDSL